MQQYLDVLQKILDEGVEKESGRDNMPNTMGISHAVIQMDLSKGFPLLTTKKLHFKGIVNELLWFLRGDTNIKWLIENGTNIWNDDAYRWYLKFAEDNGGDEQNCILKFVPEHDCYSMYTHEEFVEAVKNTPADELPVYKFTETYVKKHGGITEYKLGDLGKIYGYQWRNQNGVDQVKDVIDGLKKNPYSRYHIIDGWNKADFPEMALPPCHLLYQFIVRPLTTEQRWEYLQSVEWNDFKQQSVEDTELNRICNEHNVPKFYLDLNLYQRSCDTMLGVPYNISSMSILLKIMAKVSNMLPGVATWIGGDTHLYVNHLPAVDEQLAREPKELPTMEINKEINTLENILALKFEDFDLQGYNPHPKLKNPTDLFTGIKKLDSDFISKRQLGVVNDNGTVSVTEILSYDVHQNPNAITPQ